MRTGTIISTTRTAAKLSLLALAGLLVITGCSRQTSQLEGDDDPVRIPDAVDAITGNPQAGDSQSGEPGSALVTIDLPAFNKRSSSQWGPALQDIMNHEAPGDSNSYDDLITLGHETTHGINSHVRNRMNNTGKRANGYYLMDNRAALVEEPNMRKSQVAPFVPQSLRNSRYNLYLAGQSGWDDMPTYIMDEWVAYINGSAAGVDLVNKGIWRAGWRDGVKGTIDFCVFSVALGMAIERHDPAYFKSNTQFREFLAFNLKRGMKVFFEGRKMTDFADQEQDDYYRKFRDGTEASAMREFLNRTYGEAWVKAAVFSE